MSWVLMNIADQSYYMDGMMPGESTITLEQIDSGDCQFTIEATAYDSVLNEASLEPLGISITQPTFTFTPGVAMLDTDPYITIDMVEDFAKA